MPTTTTYTTNGTFHVTASSVAVNISAWGAGGNGNANGTGGSGGAYAAKSVTLPTGSYSITVGQVNSDGKGNGGNSTFVSSSVILVRAAGGRSDGVISHQAALNTGSTKYVGGSGGTFTTDYGNYGGAGGGSAAGGIGNGIAGQNGYDSGASFQQFGHPLDGASGANGGAAGGGNGGAAAYYDAGPNARLIPATDGDAPGGGGGGGYSGESSNTVVTEGRGGVGRVTITY